MHASEIFGFCPGMARSTRRRNVGSECPALSVFVAQDLVISVETETVGRYEQAVLGQRKAVNRVHVE